MECSTFLNLQQKVFARMYLLIKNRAPMLANTIFEVIGYIDNPISEKDQNSKLKYKTQKIFTLFFLIFTINTSILAAVLPLKFQRMTTSIFFDFEKVIAEANILVIFSIIFLEPLVKELIFRGFLTKIKKHFKLLFYLSAFLFALTQMANIDYVSSNIFLSFTLLLFGQTLFGLILGFTRIRFGILWSYILYISSNTFSQIFLFILWSL